MTERGFVQAIEGNKIHIQQGNMAEASCFGCMKTECKNKKIIIIAENPLDLPLEMGQNVEFCTNTALTLKQALMALGLPIICFFAGFLFTGLAFPDSGDPARAAAGLILMLAAAFGFYQHKRRFPAVNPFRITRIC